MFDYRFLSQENIVKILLSCDKELKLSYDLYQDFLFLIKEKRFKKFKEILENNYNKFKAILKANLRTFKK